jgi:two-component system phosphate regulon sensor histidine kinase PhoR
MSEVSEEKRRDRWRPTFGRALCSGVLPEALGLAFVATLLAGFVAAGAIAKHTLRTQVEACATQEGQTLAQTFAAALGSVAAQDGQAAQDLLQKLCTNEAWRVQWVGQDGQPRAQWPMDYSASGQPGTAGASQSASGSSGPVSEREAARTYTATVYSVTGEKAGAVHLQVAARGLGQHTAELWKLYALAAGATLVLFAFLYRQLRHHLRPMAAIQSSLSSHAAGIEKELVTLTLSDSLGEVARTWNHLIAETAEWQRRARSGETADLDKEMVQRFETRTLRQILDRLPFGVLRVGHDQRVSYANAFSAELLGRSAEDLVGTPLTVAVGEEAVARAAAGIGTRSGAVSLDRNRGQDDHQITLRFLILPPDQGSGGETLITIQDVSHLQEAERARDNFLYHVTHEFRTPLTNIQAYTETLTKQEFDDEQTRKECYNVIVSETRRLSRLVEDILNVSQLEVGSARLEMGDVDLLRLMRQTVQDNLGAADEKGIDLTLKLPPKVPKIRADKQRVAVLLNNLIGNAIKYTPHGQRVDVVLRVTDRAVEISVTDTGIGIEPADQPHVFDKFYRAANDSVQAVSGSGLGLAIAREVARLHGGDIQLESEPGTGSTFVVQLPKPAAVL